MTHDLLPIKRVEGHGEGAASRSVPNVEVLSDADDGGNLELENRRARLEEAQSRNYVLETRCRVLLQRSSQLEGRRKRYILV